MSACVEIIITNRYITWQEENFISKYENILDQIYKDRKCLYKGTFKIIVSTCTSNLTGVYISVFYIEVVSWTNFTVVVNLIFVSVKWLI